MATCTVSMTADKASLSGQVEFLPMPNQVIANVWIDSSPITAEINSTNGYQAVLTQGARYRVKSERFAFHRGIFTCPAEATANLYDLLDGLRTD